MPFKISRIQRLSAVTGISMTFFIAEISGILPYPLKENILIMLQLAFIQDLSLSLPMPFTMYVVNVRTILGG